MHTSNLNVQESQQFTQLTNIPLGVCTHHEHKLCCVCTQVCMNGCVWDAFLIYIHRVYRKYMFYCLTLSHRDMWRLVTAAGESLSLRDTAVCMVSWWT